MKKDNVCKTSDFHTVNVYKLSILLLLLTAVHISWALLCHIDILFSRLTMLKMAGKIIKTKATKTKKITVI